jgi:DNA-binding CsgD family transcriptional regulator
MAQFRLTHRELEVLNLLASGHTNRGIAESLSISEYSVKKHVSAIIQKLYARNRVHAAALAVQKGLVQPTIAEVLDGHSGQDHASPGAPLTAWEKLTLRETEIVMLLSEPRTIEFTNEALAQEMCITRNTLRKHLRSIYKKLNAKSRAGLVRLSLEDRRERKPE